MKTNWAPSEKERPTCEKKPSITENFTNKPCKCTRAAGLPWRPNRESLNFSLEEAQKFSTRNDFAKKKTHFFDLLLEKTTFR